MQINLNFEYRQEDLEDVLDYNALALYVLEHEQQPDNTEVSITFVTDERIHELNRTFRGIDRPTDVLSFECDGLEDDDEDFTPQGFGADEAYQLGDIVIAPDVAQEQSVQYGTGLHDELSLLLVHGLLHICGYDHIQDDEAAVMEARERELLTGFYGKPFER